MKKILSLLLVVVLALSMAACGNNPDPTEPPTDPTVPTNPTNPTDPTPPPTDPTDPTDDPTDPTDVAVTLDMLTMTYGTDLITLYMMDGALIVDATIDGVRKVGELDASALATIETALNESGLLALDGATEWGEEMGKTAGYYVSYSDWTAKSANYEGVDAPEAFVTGYNTVKSVLVTLLADLPVFVPEIQVFEPVDADLLNELQPMLNNSGIQGLDQMFIQGIPMDDAESFAFTAGLSSAEGVTAGANCGSMMITTAYSLIVVKAADTDAVAADFAANLDWNKWICVRPSNAAIFVKGDMVACLMASDLMYTQTVDALTNAGWTSVNELTNPEM